MNNFLFQYTLNIAWDILELKEIICYVSDIKKFLNFYCTFSTTI